MQPQALVARTTPVFSNFLFKKFIFITFLCFFIISSLFSYFNLFVSIFIQSYVNIKLHVYRYKLHVSTPGFQFRGGGGAHLKKLRRTEGGANIFGVFRVKNHDFTPKNHIFSNFKGGARRVRPPPGSFIDTNNQQGGLLVPCGLLVSIYGRNMQIVVNMRLYEY